MANKLDTKINKTICKNKCKIIYNTDITENNELKTNELETEKLPEPKNELETEKLPEPKNKTKQPTNKAKKNKKIYKLADMCAGTGAFSLAFEKTKKVNTVYANDCEKNSKKIYDANFTTELTLKDIHDIDIKTEIPKIDILTAGFRYMKLVVF